MLLIRMIIKIDFSNCAAKLNPQALAVNLTEGAMDKLLFITVNGSRLNFEFSEVIVTGRNCHPL